MKLLKSLFFLSLYMLCLTSTVSAENATLAWSKNTEPDLAGYKIYYGTASRNYGASVDVGKQTSRTLTGLTTGTTYYFALTAYDSAQNESPFSAEVTKTIADLIAPALTSIAANNLTSSNAVITWMSNEAATSRVEYGLTTAYGSASATNNTLVVSHSRTLTGLAANTTYQYRIISTDASGNTATSGNFSFTTNAALDTTPPVLNTIEASNVTPSSAVITWLSNEGATSRVEYGLTTTYGSTSAANTTLLVNHSRTLTGLAANTIYQYRVISTDASGNTAASGNFSFTTNATPDTTPPVLSSVTVAQFTDSTATITWNTHEAATSLVEYGTNATYGTTSSLNNRLVTGHNRTLVNLSPNQIYHYRVISTDGAGNTARSSNATFKTAQAPDTRPPNLSDISSHNLSGNSTQISWGTDESATGQVEYGETSTYGNLTPLNQTLLTAHQFILTALQPNTQYHYRIRSSDSAGNLTLSSNHTFTSMPPTADEALRAFSGHEQIVLEWLNPSDPGFVGVRIHFRTDRFPADIDDGSPVGDFAGKPGEKGAFIHEGLKNGETYYYIAASYDELGNFQKAVRVSATPVGKESAGGGGGCGLIIPPDGDAQGPGDAADMMTLLAILLLLLVKKGVKTCSSRALSPI